MASIKHEHSKEDEEPEAKRAKLSVLDPQESGGKPRVELNPADCDLDFNIESTGLQGYALHEQGFAYCWSGARANVGIKGGKYCFGCKIISAQNVEMVDTPPDQQHVCRVGISRGDDTVASLGETEYSYGFGGTGKFSNSGKFSNFGEKFGVGDTIVCVVNLENKPLASVGFWKNGKWLGTAGEFDVGPNGLGLVNSPVRNLQWETAVFPHVLLKNVVVQMQFSVEDGLVPEEGFKPWDCAYEDGNAVMGPNFLNPKNCELIMMVGLPASGKTTWAEKWVKERPEKRYVLLGTNLALDQMKVPGLVRKKNYGERFDRLMDRATGIFNILLSRAAKTPRNYIIDQTNVYKSARKRKLKPFVNYHKIAVVIFPKPDELKLRAEKRFAEMGKEVPAEAVNEMLANYVLPMSKDMPGSDEVFDQVMFPEMNREKSQRYLDDMKLALGSSSNSNSKSNFSEYHSESSRRSFFTPSPQNHGALSAPSGYQQNSHSPLPLQTFNHQIPQQVSRAYSGAGLQEKAEFFTRGYQSVSADSNCSIARGGPSGNDSSYSQNSFPQDERTYGGYDHYRRPNLENRNHTPGVARTDPYYGYGGVDPNSKFNTESRNPFPGGGADPYHGFGLVDPYLRSNSESRNPIAGGGRDPYCSHGGVDPHNFERASSLGSNFGSPRTSLPYSISGGHFAAEPRSVTHAPREPAFEPRGHFSTSYSSSYGTPPPRPSYGNVPTTNQQHPGGHHPLGPRYH
ncbi:SPla/RYanodine receptor subgroup [Macleaya cordata]|uniref:SPla/RYanodine receptor subgroup n=1 Tax=Macleaya cordata TaxID=56857 RepID=A0A200QVE0_MACCD|nr:SPla/RYanodine receptor subgroup [Macleaya cordata]